MVGRCCPLLLFGVCQCWTALVIIGHRPRCARVGIGLSWLATDGRYVFMLVTVGPRCSLMVVVWCGWRLSGACGRAWLRVVVVGCCLLAVVGCWWLVVAVGWLRLSVSGLVGVCCWLLVVGVGCCWWLLVLYGVVACCLMLIAVGSCRPLLAVVLFAGCCRRRRCCVLFVV